MDKLKTYIPWIALILVLMYLWYDQAHPTIEFQKEMVEVDVHHEIIKLKPVYYACVNTATYGDEAKERLDVPDSVKADKSKHVTAATEIAPYEGKTTVTAVLDVDTGVTSMLSRREPLPFFSLLNTKEIGLGYGQIGAEMGFDIYGRWDFLRIGKIHAHAYIEFNNTGNGKIMIRGGYRF